VSCNCRGPGQGCLREPKHNEHMISRPQDCNLPPRDELLPMVVDEAVSEIMNMTRPPTRGEIADILHRVYVAGCAHG
jgi:hypothetical protein